MRDTAIIMETNCRVGFIGIGTMGLAMAKNLHGRGFGVSVRDIRPEAEHEAQAVGMKIAATPSSLAVAVDLIIVVVVNAQQVDAVLFGADGVAQQRLAGKTVMLCSTIAPQDTIRFAERLAHSGIATIDAPVSGGPARAEAGTISMMLAGEKQLLERFAHVLAALSDKRFYLGDKIGDGAKTKLVNNLLAGANLVAAAEALALGMKAGLDPRQLFNVICASSGASWIFEDRMQRVLQDDFAPRAFAHILAKDMALATGMANTLDADTPIGDAALKKFHEALAHGWGELDDAAIIKTYFAKDD